MGLVLVMGLVGVLGLSLLLSYLTAFSFWQYSIAVFALFVAILVANAVISWLNDQRLDSTIPLNRQPPPLDEIPSWSHSNFANTKTIKLSTDTPPQLLDPEHPFDQQGFHGSVITYPNSSLSRFFVNRHYFDDDNLLTREFRYWSGQLDQLMDAPKLDIANDASNIEAFGIDEDWTLLRVEYFQSFRHQFFLLDHRTKSLTPLSERLPTDSASQGLISDNHYYAAVSQEPKKLLLTLYGRAKNYDSFFSARGHYLPRDSRVFIISESEPQAQLLAHLRLGKEGVVIGLEHKDQNLLIHAIDERDTEKTISRYWGLSLSGNTSD